MRIVNFGRKSLSTPAEEAYRVLRTNIQFCSFDRKIKTLAITSCNPGEGKTTTAINLSISMAKTGLKVLLVDADLRKPMMSKYLNRKVNFGLSNVILGYLSIEDAVTTTETENFYFIGCGPKPPNPAELLASANFSKFLAVASEKFDMVVIDTPPLGSVIDCALIASQTDGTILVIQHKAVDYIRAKRVKEQLEKANARILGVVLNKMVKSEFKSYYGRYNYYGYGKEENERDFRLFKLPGKSNKVMT